jgi:two-component system response regulator YesN
MTGFLLARNLFSAYNGTVPGQRFGTISDDEEYAVYRLMIVEDEYTTRDGLVHAVPWASIGIEVAGAAADGQEALAMVDQVRPDIIITDVKMDNLDGLSMIEELRKHYPEIKIMVLSGYDESGYIRRSMELKVAAYLLKPIRGRELLEQVSLRIAEIEEENARIEKFRHMEDEFDRNRGLLTEHLLADLVTGKITDYNQFKTREQYLRIGLEQKSCRCALFFIEAFDIFIQHNGYERLQKIYNTLYEYLKNTDNCTIFSFYSEEYFFPALIVFEGESPPAGVLENAAKKAGRDCGVSIALCLGEKAVHIMDAYKSYKSALAEAERKKLWGGGRNPLDNFADRVLNFIENNYSRYDLSLDILSDYMKINPSYLSRIFRKKTGSSFIEFLIRTRMEKARTLLEKTELRIREIGEKVGYLNPKYFCTVFKRYNQCTPAEFRSGRYRRGGVRND